MIPGRVPLDFPALARPAALALLGDPNPRMSTTAELRYGRKGSLQVTIAADRDVEGAGQKTAAALTERFRAEGRRVRIYLPETIGHDFCDELNGGG